MSHAKFLLTTAFTTNITSDSVTRVNDSTRLESRFLVTRTRLESRWERWWLYSNRLESRFSQNDSTRVTINDSSQSHFCKISASDRQTQFVCIQRNDQNCCEFSAL